MKRTQFLVAASQICLLVCLCHASYGDEAAWAERQLEGWQPGPEHAQVPMDSIRYPRMDITGKWDGDRLSGHDHSHLSITPLGKHTYDVAFSTMGCVGDWRLRRSAKYNDGVLTLDRPVIEHFPTFAYRKLYAVRIARQEYLLPSVAVKRVHEVILTDGSLALGQHAVPRFLFARRAPKKRRMLLRLPSRATVLILVAICAGAGLSVSVVLLERTRRT